MGFRGRGGGIYRRRRRDLEVEAAGSRGGGGGIRFWRIEESGREREKSLGERETNLENDSIFGETLI